MVWQDRIAGRIAAEFIVENPLFYVKLTARRLWTVLLPFNPRAEQRLVQRFAFTIYWLVVVPAGLVGIARSVRWPPLEPRLLALVAATSLAGPAAAPAGRPASPTGSPSLGAPRAVPRCRKDRHRASPVLHP